MHLVCPLFKDWCFKLILCEVASLESSRDRRLPGRGEFLCVEPSPVSCSLHTLRQQHSLAKTHVNTDTKLVIILKAFFLGTICQWHLTKLCSTDTWKNSLCVWRLWGGTRCFCLLPPCRLCYVLWLFTASSSCFVCISPPKGMLCLLLN